LAADDHRVDLHKLLMDGKEHQQFETEARKAKHPRFSARKHAREHPRVVDR
jgi:hypothetical protein